ncbi:hypothetical protein [Pseudomonas sp. GM102]|uniref:hypothetical protein n=1 Tax=unclassified Pseudomonas TaxID=196821 RepID=UPI001EE68DCD|nr:hypothetical protein [Pseudomonas sp. GM102]
MPTIRYSRQPEESTEDVMLPLSSAMLGPHTNRTLSAKGLSFVGGIDEQATGMIQALGVWPGQVQLRAEDCQLKL